MPIFEFHCQNCQDDFEKIVLGTNTKVKCPRCESGKVRKKLSAFSFKSGSKSVAASNSGGGCGGCSSHHCSTCH
jgi:putative FmdB family regulatory protein